MLSYQICEIFKNTYFEEHVRTTASICFTWKYYNNEWWRVWIRRDLDSVLKISFFNTSISIVIKFFTLHAF